MGEIMEKITDSGIIAITKNNLILEVLLKMLEFPLYVRELCIKLIQLRGPCGT